MEKTSLQEAAAALAGPVHDLARLYRTANKDLQAYIWQNVGLMFRHLEKFAPIHMSSAAYAEALRMGLSDPDLRNRHWGKRGHLTGDDNQKVFHWEHVVTVGDFQRLLLDGPERTRAEVERMLCLSEIAWVLVEEDKELDRRKYDSKRLIPADGISNKGSRRCYEKAGINLILAGAPLS